MSNKKGLLVGLAAAIIANSAIAGSVTTPTVTLSGYLKANYGYVHQEKKFRKSALNNPNSSELRNNYLTNETKIVVGVEDKSSNGLSYGAKVVLNADTSDQPEEDYTSFDYSAPSSDSRIAQQTYVYIAGNDFGRFAAGSYPGLVNAANASAECVDVAPVGINGMIRHWINAYTASNNIDANTDGYPDNAPYPMRTLHKMAPGLFLDSVADSGVTSKNANKISYQTPDFGGFFLAVDYIPDSQVSGTISSASTIRKRSYSVLSTADMNNRVGAYYDVVRGAIAYSGQMNQQLAIKLAATGETGHGKKTENAGVPAGRIHDLRGWQFGGAIKYMGYKIAGAYGDAGRYAGLNSESVKRTKYWNAGIGFEQDRAALSVTYSNNKKGLIITTANPNSNSFRTTAVGGSYIITKGAAIEGNVTYFKAKDNVVNSPAPAGLTLNNKGYQAGVQLKVNL